MADDIEEPINPLLQLAIACVPVLAAINIFGGIVAGIWLALRKEWGVIGAGVLGLLVSSLLLSVLLLPAMLFNGPAALAIEKGKVWLARLLFALGSLYVTALMWFWAIFVTGYLVMRTHHESLFPTMLWAYGVVTGPWTYLASKGPNRGSNDFEVIANLFLQIGYVMGALFFLTHPESPHYLGSTLVVILLTGWVIQQEIVRKMIKSAALENLRRE